MTRPRLLTLVVLGIAVASTLCEANTTRIHVTDEVVQQTFSGDPTSLQLGDRRLNTVDLFDESRTNVGTGAGCCPMVSIPRLDTREARLLTAEFPEGQIMGRGWPRWPRSGRSRGSACWAVPTTFVKPAATRCSS
jgi:hypothetical protein